MMKTPQILGLMKVVSWIVFIGLCIKTGTLLTSFAISLFKGPEAAQGIEVGQNLTELYHANLWYYINLMSFTVILSGLKAYLFYLVIQIFIKIDFDSPFNSITVNLISKISHIALAIGIIAFSAQSYSKWLINRGFIISRNWDSSDFLFLAGIIYIIALVFKRGMEIQTENELTI